MRRLLDVAECGDPTQRPVVGVRRGAGARRGAQQQERDVVEVGAVRLLVDGALVELGVARARLHGVHVDDGQRREQHLVVRLYQAPGATVPRRAVQKQAVDVHALLHTPARYSY